MDLVEWYSDQFHIDAKIKMDQCFIWFKWYKKQLEDYKDRLYDEYHKSKYFEESVDYFFKKLNKPNTPEQQKMWEYSNQIDNYIYEKNIFFMKQMIDISGFLWA